ncbi:MAG: hypothetical protein JW807_05075 [Spirochaetes bacterium]|nr:hypothetical protein [Spirochaetota bacterium]
MKRYKHAVVFLFIFVLLFPVMAAASASISLGGTAWYVWWQPAWADNKWTGLYQWNDVAGYWFEDAHDFKPSSAAMAGPIISISFLDRWTISTVTVLGRMNFHTRNFATGLDYIDGVAGVTNKGYSRSVLKWDSDTTIGCALHRYFKLYAGFKAQGYRYRETIHYYDFVGYPTINIIHSEGTDSVECYGPGLGVGVTVPLVENLYLLVNLSGVFLWCTEKADQSLNDSYTFTPTAYVFSQYYLPRGRFISYGGAASLSLAYTIDRINTTLALGGRYQLLFNRQRTGNLWSNDVTMNIIDRQYDHFFGFTLSAIYTFHIGKRG